MTVDILLDIISAHCILVQAVEFRATSATQLAPATLLIENHLRAIPHHFGRFSGDLGPEIKFILLLVGFQSPLLFDNFISPLSIVDQKLLRWRVPFLLIVLNLMSVDLWLEGKAIDFLATLLAPSIA